jgi:hypothetical protein
MTTLRLNPGQTVIQRNGALGHRLRVQWRSATRHLNPGIWAEKSSCGIKLPEFETLVALKSRTARQSERGEGPTFSFVMKKGRSVASAKCDWPQAAGFFHCIGIGLRENGQEVGPELQTLAVADAAESRVRARGGV